MVQQKYIICYIDFIRIEIGGIFCYPIQVNEAIKLLKKKKYGKEKYILTSAAANTVLFVFALVFQ